MLGIKYKNKKGIIINGWAILSSCWATPAADDFQLCEWDGTHALCNIIHPSSIVDFSNGQTPTAKWIRPLETKELAPEEVVTFLEGFWESKEVIKENLSRILSKPISSSWWQERLVTQEWLTPFMWVPIEGRKEAIVQEDYQRGYLICKEADPHPDVVIKDGRGSFCKHIWVEPGEEGYEFLPKVSPTWQQELDWKYSWAK